MMFPLKVETTGVGAKAGGLNGLSGSVGPTIHWVHIYIDIDLVTCYFHYTLISVHLRVFRPTCICYTRGRLPEVSMPFLGSHFAEKIFWQMAQRKKQTMYQRYLEEEETCFRGI